MRAMIPEPSVPATLTVSIVVHESNLELLGTTLTTLAEAVLHAHSEGTLSATSLMLFDNGSSPQYRDTLTRFVTHELHGFTDKLSIELRLGDSNLGFGRGHNRALSGASSDYLLILNPDVALAEDALHAAVQTLRRKPEVVALNPHCIGATGQREFLCKRYPTLADLALRALPYAGLRRRFGARLARYEYQDLTDKGLQSVRLLSGACLLCQRQAFHDCGGFDPSFFMYFEDFDLSLRLASHGTLTYLPDMRIVHHGGYAARKGARHIRWFAVSGIRFFGKHGWRLW